MCVMQCPQGWNNRQFSILSGSPTRRSSRLRGVGGPLALVLVACSQGFDAVNVDLSSTAQAGGAAETGASRAGGSTTSSRGGQEGRGGAISRANPTAGGAGRGGTDRSPTGDAAAAARTPTGDAAVAEARAPTGDAAVAEARAPVPLDGAGGSASNETVARTCSGICNAAEAIYPTVSRDSGRGNVTMYCTTPSAGGGCNYGTTEVEFYAAMNVHVVPGDYQGQWRDGKACGQCVQVTAYTSKGPKSVVVRIMDRCADVNCGVDLGGKAPAAVMADDMGRYNGEWSFVSCAGHPEVSDGPPVVFVNSGSNEYWSLIQIRNPDWPVASVSWRLAGDPATGGSFTYAGTLSENYWQVPADLLRTGDKYVLTIEYDDQSISNVEVTSGDLAKAGNVIPLR